jgi:hypothetical protein
MIKNKLISATIGFLIGAGIMSAILHFGSKPQITAMATPLTNVVYTTTIGPQDYWYFMSPLSVESLYIGSSNGVLYLNGVQLAFTNVITVQAVTNVTYGSYETNGVTLLTSPTNEYGTFRALQ